MENEHHSRSGCAGQSSSRPHVSCGFGVTFRPFTVQLACLCSGDDRQFITCQLTERLAKSRHPLSVSHIDCQLLITCGVFLCVEVTCRTTLQLNKRCNMNLSLTVLNILCSACRIRPTFSCQPSCSPPTKSRMSSVIVHVPCVISFQQLFITRSCCQHCSNGNQPCLDLSLLTLRINCCFFNIYCSDKYLLSTNWKGVDM